LAKGFEQPKMSGLNSSSKRFNWKPWAAALAIAGVFAVFFWLNASLPRLAIFWIFGLALGFILQRSRFCFVSAISNSFLFRDTRLLEGILGGLFIATIGFAFIMYQISPHPTDNNIPFAAIVSPFGWHLALGGLLFGCGMMLGGGCIVGNLHRIGEGSLSAVVAFLGILLGMGALQFTWPWWWQNYIGTLSPVWLPAKIGWWGAIILTLLVITVLFVIVRRVKAKMPVVVSHHAQNTRLSTKFINISRAIFCKAWPLALGGIVLGIVNVLLFRVADRPLTVTGETMSWAQGLFTLVQLPPPAFDSVPGT